MIRSMHFVAAAVCACGCASTATQTDTAYEDKEYVTGSRIPVKDKSSTPVKTTSDRKAINDMVRPGGNASGGVSGAGGS
jgi:hypothetical protein